MDCDFSASHPFPTHSVPSNKRKLDSNEDDNNNNTGRHSINGYKRYRQQHAQLHSYNAQTKKEVRRLKRALMPLQPSMPMLYNSAESKNSEHSGTAEQQLLVQTQLQVSALTVVDLYLILEQTGCTLLRSRVNKKSLVAYLMNRFSPKQIMELLKNLHDQLNCLFHLKLSSKLPSSLSERMLKQNVKPNHNLLTAQPTPPLLILPSVTATVLKRVDDINQEYLDDRLAVIFYWWLKQQQYPQPIDITPTTTSTSNTIDNTTDANATISTPEVLFYLAAQPSRAGTYGHYQHYCCYKLHSLVTSGNSSSASSSSSYFSLTEFRPVGEQEPIALDSWAIVCKPHLQNNARFSDSWLTRFEYCRKKKGWLRTQFNPEQLHQVGYVEMPTANTLFQLNYSDALRQYLKQYTCRGIQTYAEWKPGCFDHSMNMPRSTNSAVTKSSSTTTQRDLWAQVDALKLPLIELECEAYCVKCQRVEFRRPSSTNLSAFPSTLPLLKLCTCQNWKGSSLQRPLPVHSPPIDSDDDRIVVANVTPSGAMQYESQFYAPRKQFAQCQHRALHHILCNVGRDFDLNIHLQPLIRQDLERLALCKFIFESDSSLSAATTSLASVLPILEEYLGTV
jgi:hypothetical protein